MILNLSGGGSSGAALNFKVVGGTTEPANPSENTIWVNTDQTITSWIFSATEPAEPAEGMVWIKTGMDSNVEFNALKNNGVQVYPVSAMQYINGTWTEKTVKSYQNGEMVDIRKRLYWKGNEYAALTGGWEGVNTSTYYANGTLTKNSEDITIKATGTQGMSAATVNTIDLTNINTIYVNAISDGDAYLAVASNNKWQWGSMAAKAWITNNGGYNVIALDVSNMTGRYYIGVYLTRETSGTSTVTFDEVWYE